MKIINKIKVLAIMAASCACANMGAMHFIAAMDLMNRHAGKLQPAILTLQQRKVAVEKRVDEIRRTLDFDVRAYLKTKSYSK